MTPMPGLDQLLSRLQRMKAKAIAFEWLTHMSWMVTALSAAFVLLAILGAITIPAVAVRVTLVGVILLGLAALLVIALAKSTIWSPGPERLALAVESKYPELKNRLIASLQLADKARSNPEAYSLALVDLTIRQATEMSDVMDFALALDRSRLRRSARWAGVALGTALVLSLLFPSLAKQSWNAYSRPLDDYSAPIPYKLTVTPGSVEAVKFDDFRIVAKVEGADLPHTISVFHRSEGGDWHTEADLPPDVSAANSSSPVASALEFHQVLPQVKRDFEYYVVAGKLTSPVYKVAAVDRPRVSSLRLEVYPPSYTGLPPVVLDNNDGAITAPAGSKATIRVESNRPLAQASMSFSDGKNIGMQVKGQTATYDFVVDANRSYHLALVDESGRSNPNPIEYAITSLPDREPSVEIEMPGHNLDLDENMAVDLKIVARDDYGFSRMVLHTRWISEGEQRAARDIPIPDSRIQGERLEQAYFWDLAKWGMMPDDIVEYEVEVADNDAINGPKVATSKTFTLRLPSLDEMMTQFEEQRDASLESLDKVLGGQRDLSQQIEKLRRELAPQQEFKWDDQKKIGDVAQRSADLEKQLDQVTQDMQQQVTDAQDRKLASMEMLQKMAEAQQLFEEVATPEMKEAQKKLQEALAKMDPDEVKRALAQMNLSQDEMIKRLDRTIDYLKKLKAEQQVDSFVRRLEEMRNQEEALEKQAKESPKESLPTLAPPQSALKDRFEDFTKDLAAAESTLTDAKVALPEKISEFCKSASKSPTPGQMKKTAQAMQGQDQQGSEQGAGECKASMDSLLAQMKSFQSQMSQHQQEQMARELREALDKALYLSQEQEGLLNETGQYDANSLSLRDLAARQEILRQATEDVAAQLTEMAKKSSAVSMDTPQQLGQAMQNMTGSAQCLSDRKGPSAGNNQREALFGLNTAAQELVSSMDKNSNSQCKNPNPNNPGDGQCNNPKPGAMGKMAGLSQQQGRLNQEMGESGQSSGTMTEGERETLKRLKGEQEAIKKGVDDLNSQVGDQKTLGRLDKLSEEMKKVVEDMGRGEVSQETRDRQRRIYGRMLEFQHALQKQDYKDERQATTAQGNYDRPSPPGLPDAAGMTDEEYQRLLTRYQDEGYPKEYEETIKAYFRALADSRSNTAPAPAATPQN
jgi:hypothetical protein